MIFARAALRTLERGRGADVGASAPTGGCVALTRYRMAIRAAGAAFSAASGRRASARLVEQVEGLTERSNGGGRKSPFITFCHLIYTLCYQGIVHTYRTSTARSNMRFRTRRTALAIVLAASAALTAAAPATAPPRRHRLQRIAGGSGEARLSMNPGAGAPGDVIKIIPHMSPEHCPTAAFGCARRPTKGLASKRPAVKKPQVRRRNAWSR